MGKRKSARVVEISTNHDDYLPTSSSSNAVDKSNPADNHTLNDVLVSDTTVSTADTSALPPNDTDEDDLTISNNQVDTVNPEDNKDANDDGLSQNSPLSSSDQVSETSPKSHESKELSNEEQVLPLSSSAQLDLSSSEGGSTQMTDGPTSDDLDSSSVGTSNSSSSSSRPQVSKKKPLELSEFLQQVADRMLFNANEEQKQTTLLSKEKESQEKLLTELTAAGDNEKKGLNILSKIVPFAGRSLDQIQSDLQAKEDCIRVLEALNEQIKKEQALLDRLTSWFGANSKGAVNIQSLFQMAKQVVKASPIDEEVQKTFRVSLDAIIDQLDQFKDIEELHEILMQAKDIFQRQLEMLDVLTGKIKQDNKRLDSHGSISEDSLSFVDETSIKPATVSSDFDDPANTEHAQLRIAAMEREMGQAANAYSKAKRQLDKITKKFSSNEKIMSDLKGRLDSQRARIENRNKKAGKPSVRIWNYLELAVKFKESEAKQLALSESLSTAQASLDSLGKLNAEQKRAQQNEITTILQQLHTRRHLGGIDDSSLGALYQKACALASDLLGEEQKDKVIKQVQDLIAPAIEDAKVTLRNFYSQQAGLMAREPEPVNDSEIDQLKKIVGTEQNDQIKQEVDNETQLKFDAEQKAAAEQARIEKQAHEERERDKNAAKLEQAKTDFSIAMINMRLFGENDDSRTKRLEVCKTITELVGVGADDVRNSLWRGQIAPFLEIINPTKNRLTDLYTVVLSSLLRAEGSLNSNIKQPSDIDAILVVLEDQDGVSFSLDKENDGVVLILTKEVIVKELKDIRRTINSNHDKTPKMNELDQFVFDKAKTAVLATVASSSNSTDNHSKPERERFPISSRALESVGMEARRKSREDTIARATLHLEETRNFLTRIRASIPPALVGNSTKSMTSPPQASELTNEETIKTIEADPQGLPLTLEVPVEVKNQKMPQASETNPVIEDDQAAPAQGEVVAEAAEPNQLLQRVENAEKCLLKAYKGILKQHYDHGYPLTLVLPSQGDELTAEMVKTLSQHLNLGAVVSDEDRRTLWLMKYHQLLTVKDYNAIGIMCIKNPSDIHKIIDDNKQDLFPTENDQQYNDIQQAKDVVVADSAASIKLLKEAKKAVAEECLLNIYKAVFSKKVPLSDLHAMTQFQRENASKVVGDDREREIIEKARDLVSEAKAEFDENINQIIDRYTAYDMHLGEIINRGDADADRHASASEKKPIVVEIIDQAQRVKAAQAPTERASQLKTLEGLLNNPGNKEKLQKDSNSGRKLVAWAAVVLCVICPIAGLVMAGVLAVRSHKDKSRNTVNFFKSHGSATVADSEALAKKLKSPGR